MRRQSLSAPARLCIGRLETATRHLDQSILSLSSFVSKSSEVLAHPESSSHTSEQFTKLNTNKMPCTCHGCHAPLDDDHLDYPSGWQKCPLEHWDGCKGGIADGKAANGSEWKGCPSGHVFVEVTSSDEDLESGLESRNITLGKVDDKLGDVVDGTVDETGNSEAAGGTPRNQDQTKPDDDLEVVESVEVSKDSDHVVTEGDLLVQQLEEANILLKKQVATRAREEEAARVRKIAMLKAENIRLAQAMNGDIGGARVKTTTSVPHPKNKKQARVATGLGRSQQPLQEHLSRNQLRAAEYRPADDTIYTGLNIRGIRKIPDIKTQVEKLVNQVQGRAPSLDRRPSFVPVKDTPPGTAFIDPHHDDVVVEQQFVYQYCEDGSLKKVKVLTPQSRGTVPSFTKSGGGHVGQGDDLEISSDEDCDEVPQSGHVFRWRRDENGEKYYIEEKQVMQQPEMVYRYVKDSTTGRSYKRLVLKNDPEKELVSHWLIDPDTGRKVQMLVPCQLSSSKLRSSRQYSSQLEKPASSSHSGRDLHCSDGFVTPLPSSVHRKSSLQSSSSIHSRTTNSLQEEKQGKIPSIVQFARSCPVSWTSKVTSDKLNMGLWCWSFIADLLATRTGQASPLQPGELEARLQHYLNVLEIALQPGSSSDFDNHVWRVARLYAEKVQHKVDRGDTWLGFDQRYGSDSQPHELMAAEKELATKPSKAPKQTKDEEVKKDDKKRNCTTWNSSSTEGKCEYEVQYDGRSCSRRHECSWCKEKGKKSLGHQRSFCRQRLAAGEQ